MQILDKESFLASSLSEFVNYTETSVRLRNSIMKATSLGTCPFPTIKDYLNAGGALINKMLCIPNLGKKTAYELDKLIYDMLSKFEISMIVNAETVKNYYDSSDLIWNGKKQSTQSLEQDLSELIKSRPTSTRLKNLFEVFFNYQNFPCRTVKDLLIGGKDVSSRLLRYKNFGRSSVKELRELVEQFLYEQADNSRENLSSKGLLELMRDFMENMKANERKVLAYRYGFDNDKIMTLDEIGGLLCLTRERIRQIEKKAISKFRLKINKIKIIDALLCDQEIIFDSLSDSKGVIWKGKKLQFLGEYLLAINVIHGSFLTWLKATAVEFRAGWLRSDLFTPEFKVCQNNIKKIIVNLRLPASFEIISEMLDGETNLARLCASLLDGYYMYEGLIYSSPPGVRKKRQANLYNILGQSSYKQLKDLVEQNNFYYHSMRCSTRDAQIVMIDAPHLFLSLNDYGWTALGIKTHAPDLNIDKEDYESLDDDNSNEVNGEESRTSLASVIQKLLEEYGPLHFISLRDHFIRKYSKKYSPNSLGPVLLGNDEFIRLAPSVYGLKKHTSAEALSKYCKILLNNIDCTRYVISRWAGEPTLAFPWWTIDMEYIWCEWAQRNAEKFMFYSLMAIAEPNDWAVNEDERQHWLQIKKKNAYYSLQFPNKHSISDRLITIRELYAIMIVASGESSMNWIRVNRILGHTLNDQHAATYLATLIALGALKPNDHWQLSHLPGARLDELIEELSFYLCKQGDLSWESDIGNSFLLHMNNENHNSSSLGWVKRDELSILLDLLGCKIIKGNEYVLNKSERELASCTLERMLYQKKQDNQQDRMAILINELIEDEYSEEVGA